MTQLNQVTTHFEFKNFNNKTFSKRISSYSKKWRWTENWCIFNWQLLVHFDGIYSLDALDYQYFKFNHKLTSK